MSIPKLTMLQGDCLKVLRTLPSDSVHCCVTSPPYWGLRDYGVEGQLGLEKTPEEYVAKMVEVFREVRRALREDGTLFLNVGDSYASGGNNRSGEGEKRTLCGPKFHGGTAHLEQRRTTGETPGLKPKDLCGIPWRLAFALQADGWWLRQDIIWAKPNPMPESVTDRCTKSHEYLFLFAKSARYYFDAEAIKEEAEYGRRSSFRSNNYTNNRAFSNHTSVKGGSVTGSNPSTGRNKRSVWTIATEPYSEAHFATFPTALVKPCILAGTSERGCCPHCGAPWGRIVESEPMEIIRSDRGEKIFGGKHSTAASGYMVSPAKTKTTGWQPTCDCGDGIDRRIVSSPEGERTGIDPSLITGRAGMNRPRSENEGRRDITRHEQALYAEQLKASPYRKQMESEVGEEAFAHYLRTDESGARPPRPEMLESWMARGWIKQVDVPESPAVSTIPCTVLDPFGGSGTTGQVALEYGRNAILIELNPEYMRLINRRTSVTPGLNLA